MYSLSLFQSELLPRATHSDLKKIIHIDADCFFAAVEVRDNPALRGKPIAVGGSASGRGVISTCSYEARAYGVRSAMASGYALRLCPDLQIIRSRFDVYREVSQQMREIFYDYSDKVQPLSLDEAYLDVSDSELCQGSATLISDEIRKRIHEKTGITVSAGIAPVKFLAKIASDWNKPNGVFTVTPAMVDEFAAGLTVEKLPGVGRVTANRMHRHGLHKCSDLREMGVESLIDIFGSYGKKLHEMAWGEDNREVSSDRRRKSLSIEKTYSEDMSDIRDINACLPGLLERLNERFANISDGLRLSTKFIKFKYSDFTQATMETRIGKFGDAFSKDDFSRLINRLWHKRQDPIRLLGLGVRFGESPGAEQLPLEFEQSS